MSLDEQEDAELCRTLRFIAHSMGYQAPEQAAVRIESQAAALVALQEQVARMTRENESLRAECGLRQIRGYREGKEAAAKLCDVEAERAASSMDRHDNTAYMSGCENCAEIIRAAIVDAAMAERKGEGK
jgi:hypothetical protein